MSTKTVALDMITRHYPQRLGTNPTSTGEDQDPSGSTQGPRSPVSACPKLDLLSMHWSAYPKASAEPGKVRFDKAVTRGRVKEAREKSKFDASDIVGKLVYYTIAFFVLQIAFGAFGPNPISELIASVIAFLPKLIVAIIIIVVVAAIAAPVKTLIEGTLGGLSYGGQTGHGQETRPGNRARTEEARRGRMRLRSRLWARTSSICGWARSRRT